MSQGGHRGCGRRPPGWLVALLAVMVVGLCPVSSPAAEPAPVDRARTLFRAGAEAYAANDFQAALQAFGVARDLVPDAALTFSIAQAHRRQYYQTRSAGHLRSALSEYRRYLTEVEKGGRRGDANQAIEELAPLVALLAQPEETPAPARAAATRLMVISSVPGAEVVVDDGPAEKAPFIGEIEPGQHVVVVTASGYRSYRREILVRRGDVAPIDASLEPLPARLLVRGDPDATLWIDGRRTAELPLSGPVAVAPGRRLVTVTKDGHRRFDLELQLDRNEPKDLAVALEPTAERTLALVTLALGGTALVASGVLVGIAVDIDGDAQEVYDQAEAGNITHEQLEAYNDDRLDRHDWVTAAGVTGAVGLALGITGGLLFWLDRATPPASVRDGGEASRGQALSIGVASTPAGFGLTARVDF